MKIDQLSGAARTVLAVAVRRQHHRAEVDRLLSAPWDDADAMDRLREARLARTVARAATASPFYRQVLAGAAPVHTLDDLAGLPVTDKADIRASGRSRTRPGGRVQPRATWGTSGSSGEPFTFEIDLGYSARHAAQRTYVYLRAGLAPGARVAEILPGRRRATRHDQADATFRRRYVGYAGDGLPEAALAGGPDLLYGNRSHLLQVADWVEETGRRPGLQLVCSSSEMLRPEDEARLRDVLGAPVLEVYGSAEASNLAFRLPEARHWKVLEPRVVVEVLDADLRPVRAGEVGQLVVTTLTEPTTPLIRYATGDLARVHTGSGDGRSGLRLAALEGRAADALVSATGCTVPFWSIASSTFWASPVLTCAIRRWQVHQRSDRSLVVRLELAPGTSLDAVAPLVEAHLTQVLGPVGVAVTPTAQVHDPSNGKFRAVTSSAVPGARPAPPPADAP